jgi:hypothetical protein
MDRPWGLKMSQDIAETWILPNFHCNVWHGYIWLLKWFQWASIRRPNSCWECMPWRFAMHDTLPYPLKRPSRSQMVGHARTHANISWAHNRNMKFFSTSRIVLNIGCSSHLLTTPLDNFFVLDLAKFKDTIYIYISQHQSVARDFFHKSIRAISNFVKA